MREIEAFNKGGKAFNKVLLESIDEGFLKLGESVKHAIYWHIERNYGIKREEIPDRLKEFHEALIGLFGAGAKVIERLVAKSLYGKLGLSFEERESWSLIDYIEEAKKSSIQS
ncbi:MAG: hypothetical protein QW265_03970 [Candidatus Bathyarchaeia archaeon]